MSQPPPSQYPVQPTPPQQYPLPQPVQQPIQQPPPVQPIQQPYIAPFDPYQAEAEEKRLNTRLLLLAIVWFLPGLSIIAMIFVNMASRSTNVQSLVTPTSVPTVVPRPTSAFVDLPVVTARIIPTATPRPTAVTALSPISTTEWGIVRIESEVKAEPSAGSITLEKLKENTLVAWEKKLPDSTWYMRVGGGWMPRSNVNVFSSKEAALASLLP